MSDGVAVELWEDVAGERDRAWVGEVGKLLVFGRSTRVSFGKAGMHRDLALSMLLCALLQPVHFSAGFC